MTQDDIDDVHETLCNVWKTGGVFAGAAGNGVQCGELTNLDVYSLAIFKQQNATTGRDGQVVRPLGLRESPG